MKLNNKTIPLIIGLTVLALAGLLFTQLRWLQVGMALNEELFENKTYDIISEFRKGLERHYPDLKAKGFTTGGYQVLFTKKEEQTAIEQRVYQVLDTVLAMNNISHNYRLIGNMTDGYCQFYLDPSDPYYTKELAEAQFRICFCGDHSQPGSFDMSIRLNNQTFFSPYSSGLLFPSILFIILLMGTFGYIILAVDRQKKLSELKNDFINNLTHEFKTPIFTIGLSAKMLGRSVPVQENEKLKSYVDLIDSENQRLRNQVDKVLQMAVIDSGKLALSKTKVDIHELISRVTQSFQMPVAERMGRIKLDLSAKDPLLEADETHLSNVIYNLVDNAFKYAKGAPEIDISASLQDGLMQIRIQDNGIGMSREEQNMVFDRFYRVQKDNVHDVKGFGLGLSYVKSIIDRHRGSISLESRKGKGTTFTIRLPVE